MEDLLTLELHRESDMTDGKTEIKIYLETRLPESIQKAIEDYQQGEKEQVLHLYCRWGELYGAINACLWTDIITEKMELVSLML